MIEVKLYQHVGIVESFFSVVMALKKLPPKIFHANSKNNCDSCYKNIWLSEFFSILLLTIMCDGCQFFRQRRIVNAVTHLKHYVKQESVPSKLLKYIGTNINFKKKSLV